MCPGSAAGQLTVELLKELFIAWKNGSVLHILVFVGFHLFDGDFRTPRKGPTQASRPGHSCVVVIDVWRLRLFV
ncbi:unnamed protein product [Linum trigynum]|uniref:Uncharacterized protein n=1 Tax=Linum trigynum TaxID=586398 RepID=A0AAV2GSR8_9ROSI